MNRFLPIITAIVIFFLCACGNNSNKTHTDSDRTFTDPTPEALKTLNELIKQNPEDPYLYNNRALVYLALNNIDSAFRDINQALFIDSNKADFYVTLSDIYFASGMVQNTLAALEKALLKEPRHNEALLKRAELNIYFNQYAEAVEFADKAIGYENINPKAYFIKGMVHKLRGDTANAIKNLQTCVGQDPDYYHAYMQLGLLFAARGNPVALEYYNNALNIDPISTEALYAKAMFYQESGMLNEALSAYENLLVIDSAYKFAHYNIGYIHLVYLELYREAIKYFNKAIQFDPYYVEAYYNRGYCFELLGDVLNARADYIKALDLRTNYNLAIQGLNRLD